MSEAMDRPESPEQSSCSDSESDNPGEERLTFGKHAGRRLDELDELDEGYRDWALHPNRANEPWNERWVSVASIVTPSSGSSDQLTVSRLRGPQSQIRKMVIEEAEAAVSWQHAHVVW
ncbi:hypothetical protein FA95DRAFT_1288979 [Auriscalpium vulgare]|uniref:Uncharacterized protein n=1 Tax=Auriscalpium vulgare TaxID=40419 RepID=A0ACB8RTY8_9AGAM|nr:hypothetical protein FA95DRAFT_1288979 [Auriscalpium vulgare]